MHLSRSAAGRTTRNPAQLFLDNNNLYGSIPDALNALVQLVQLWGASNNLYGTLPSSLGNMRSLRELWMARPPHAARASARHAACCAIQPAIAAASPLPRGAGE